MISLLALVSGGIVALPVGKYSDAHGRKPSVVLASLCMSGVMRWKMMLGSSGTR